MVMKRRTYLLTVCILIFLAGFSLYPWDGDVWGPLSRAQIAAIANKMINSYWMPKNTIFNYTYNSRTTFNAGTVYTGIAYCLKEIVDNWDDFSFKVNTTSGGNQAYGNDCSGFVSICWRLEKRYTTVNFENDAINAGGYCSSLGEIGSSSIVNLLRGDALVKVGDPIERHIILFDYSENSGMVSMEQTPGPRISSSEMRRNWAWNLLRDYRPIRRNLIEVEGLIAPEIFSPLNNSVVNTLTPTFNWRSVTNADYYGLYVSKSPYGEENLIFDSRTDGYIFSNSFTLPSGRLVDGNNYRWEVYAYNNSGDYAASEKWYFTIQVGSVKIAGTVNFFQGGSPISNVEVNLSGGETQNQTTGSYGTYEFVNLSKGQNYYISSSKSRSITKVSSISPLDASYVLRYYVGTLSLSEEQKIAADASGNGGVTPFDASIILRYYVGEDVSQHDIAKWKFLVPPVSSWTNPVTIREYIPLNVDQTNQNFNGILIGDATGNWIPSTMGKSNVLSNTGHIVPDEMKQIDKNLFQLPIKIEKIPSFYSLGIDIVFNNDLIHVEKVVPMEESNKVILVYYEEKYGNLRIALASSDELKDGYLLNIFYRLKSEESNKNDCQLCITGYEIDDYRIDDIKQEIVWNKVKNLVNYELRQNFPNPFNPETRFEYSLPERSEVEIAVYNIRGYKIKQIINTTQDKGEYRVIWNGVDETGSEVPSGVYFVKCVAGNFNKTIKIVKAK